MSKPARTPRPPKPATVVVTDVRGDRARAEHPAADQRGDRIRETVTEAEPEA